MMVSKGNYPQMAARFRLVNYHNLPRLLRYFILQLIESGNIKTSWKREYDWKIHIHFRRIMYVYVYIHVHTLINLIRVQIIQGYEYMYNIYLFIFFLFIYIYICNYMYNLYIHIHIFGSFQPLSSVAHNSAGLPARWTRGVPAAHGRRRRHRRGDLWWCRGNLWWVSGDLWWFTGNSMVMAIWWTPWYIYIYMHCIYLYVVLIS